MDEFKKHEIFHTASIIMDMIGNHLLDHEAVVENPRWTFLAEKAMAAMHDFYNETATNSALREMLKEIIKEKSYRYGDFVLASGAKSKYFFDLKPTMLDPTGINLIGDFIFEKIKELNYQVSMVGGMAMGAIPLVSIVAAKSYRTEMPLKAFFVRKAIKDHGTGQIIEGDYDSNCNVVCVEDVTTTGESVMMAVKAARTNCRVKDVITVVDRLEGAKENLAREGITLHSIFTRKDFE